MKVNAWIRSVFARHWIDLRQVKYTNSRGTVRIRGELRRLGGGRSQLSPGDLELFEQEIKRVSGVSRVYFELTNWSKDTGGQWKLLEVAKSDSSQAENLDEATRVYDGEKR